MSVHKLRSPNIDSAHSTYLSLGCSKWPVYDVKGFLEFLVPGVREYTFAEFEHLSADTPHPFLER